MKIKNKEYDKAFGENLKKIRKAKKLSRETLGAIAEIEAKQIYNIEVGTQSPTVATVVALAVALKLHPKKMFDFDFEFIE